ncbi:MAG: hypothetical protein ACTS5A_03925, partial [Candidatus Hodgkinia cicadicola]
PQTFNYYDIIDFWQFEDLRTYNNLTPIDLASSFEVWTFEQFSIKFSFAVCFTFALLNNSSLLEWRNNLTLNLIS